MWRFKPGMEASVIIPVRDECGNVEPICDAFVRLLSEGSSVREVIFVDDHSRDFTLDKLKSCSAKFPFIRFVTENEHRGKGAAIRRGFQEARSEILVMMDGDQEYSPLDIPRLMEPIRLGDADLVVGQGMNPQSSTVRWFFSKAFRTIFVRMFRIQVTNPNEGLKAILKQEFNELGVTASGFDFDIELLVKAKENRLRVVQVPVGRHGRCTGKSKVPVLPTTARILIRMVKLWLSQER